MEIRKGLFGKVWDGARSNDPNDYTYGYLDDVDYDFHPDRPFGMYIDWWEHFEPADPQPQWPKKIVRQVITSRVKLCRVLLAQGYEPWIDGSFKHPEFTNKSGLLYMSFAPEMWDLCGTEVFANQSGYYTTANSSYLFLPEWTEEVTE